MSMAALLQAVRDQMRLSVVGGGLAYANAECEVGWDGQPAPKAGQRFASVHPGGVRALREAEYESLSEELSCDITLSLRLGQLPVDRWGPQNLILASTGLYALAEAIRVLVHMSYAIMNAANTTIGVGANGFLEPLRYLGMEAPQTRGPEWWWAEDEATPPVGLSLKISFGQARRYQTLTSDT